MPGRGLGIPFCSAMRMHEMRSRRDLLQLGAVAAGGFLGLARIARAAGAKKIPIGLQLYSVRKQCDRDLPGVLEAVAAMGYAGVEFAGYHKREARELRRLLDDHGLVCCGTHTPLASIQGAELARTIEFNRVLGNRYLIVPWMTNPTKADWLAKARLFNEVSEKVAGEGMQVGYHAHAHDFAPVEGAVPWDLFFGNTKPDVVMQLDTGNCLGGGADPVAVLKRYPGRAVTVHLKEHGGPDDAVIGGGGVRWPDVFAVCEVTGGTRWYIVEHERKRPDPLAEVKRCLDALRAMGK